MGKTAPNAVLTGSSTFRVKCGDDGFHHDSLYVQHQSSSKVPRVSCTGDNFASMSSVLTKWLFSEMPVSMNSPSASRLSSSHWGS